MTIMARNTSSTSVKQTQPGNPNMQKEDTVIEQKAGVTKLLYMSWKSLGTHKCDFDKHL